METPKKCLNGRRLSPWDPSAPAFPMRRPANRPERGGRVLCPDRHGNCCDHNPKRSQKWWFNKSNYWFKKMMLWRTTKLGFHHQTMMVLLALWKHLAFLGTTKISPRSSHWPPVYPGRTVHFTLVHGFLKVGREAICTALAVAEMAIFRIFHSQTPVLLLKSHEIPIFFVVKWSFGCKNLCSIGFWWFLGNIPASKEGYPTGRAANEVTSRKASCQDTPHRSWHDECNELAVGQPK